jgi:hypothetical protein
MQYPTETAKEAYFSARIIIDAAGVPREIAEKLVPGTPADVLIITGERIVLAYFLEPIKGPPRQGDARELSAPRGADGVTSFPDLLGSDACGLDNRRPTCDLALNQRSKRLRAALGPIRNVAAEVEQALAHALVVERIV